MKFVAQGKFFGEDRTVVWEDGTFVGDDDVLEALRQVIHDRLWFRMTAEGPEVVAAKDTLEGAAAAVSLALDEVPSVKGDWPEYDGGVVSPMTDELATS